MAHYTGPKARINRRLGVDVYDSNGATKAARLRPFKPGMHPWRRRKLTPFGQALIEKQALRHYYGLSERQLRRFFDRAKHMPGDNGANLLGLCERRLDNVVWRAGFCRTRSQARQSVAHGHFLVNGKRCKSPSALVRAEDIVTVRDREQLKGIYTKRIEENDRQVADFIAVQKDELSLKVLRNPDREDSALPVDINQVVELLTR
ncbi:MAG: 30S ribosomal protein S4 [Planctomycetota bacterium]